MEHLLVTFARFKEKSRDISMTSVTVKMELFVTWINGFAPLTNVTKKSILDAKQVLDPFM